MIGIKMNIKTLMAKIKKTSSCWEWQGAKHPLGYGNMRVGKKTQWAHRVVYENLVGPIEEGMSLDHLCRNPSCVNPEHLEPVTHKENVLRGVGPTAINAAKTHCKRGHEFTKTNTRITVANGRLCRACDKAYKFKWQKNKTAERHAEGLTSKGVKFIDKNKERIILCPQV